MKLGLGSYACAWAIGVPGYNPRSSMAPSAFLERARSLGLSLAQFADNVPLHELAPDTLEELRQIAAHCRVDLELGTRGIGERHLLRYVELCEYFSSRLLRVVVDTAHEHPSEDEIVSRLVDLTPALAAGRVTLAIENHDRFEAVVFARIIERVNSPNVGICLDTVNSFGALEGPAVIIETLAPYVVNLHLKDFAIHRLPHMMGFEIGGAAAGQGRLDIPRLLDTLGKHGRDFNAILELWPPWQGEVGSTVAIEERWAAESVRYLRTLIPN